MISTPQRARRGRILCAAVLVAAVAATTSCDDDGTGDTPRDPSSGTTMPYVGAGTEPLDSTGGPGGTVLNNQPTSPAANNAPPGQGSSGG